MDHVVSDADVVLCGDKTLTNMAAGVTRIPQKLKRSGTMCKTCYMLAGQRSWTKMTSRKTDT